MKTFASLLRSSVISAVILTAMILLSGVSSKSFAEDLSFEGKTVTIVQGRDPGGTGDIRVRTMVPFLQKYIPPPRL